MKNPSEIIADKFNELVEKWTSQDRISTFTRAERVVWLIVTIRCAIDMDGFSSVFDQALSRNELVELIGCLNEIGMNKISELLWRAITLLDTNNFYAQDRDFITDYYLTQQHIDELEIIGEIITKNRVLWKIDDKLVAMFSKDDAA